MNAADLADFAKLERSAARRAQMMGRFVRQWVTRPEGARSSPVFVLGAQRSGTTMLIDTLRLSPEVWVHPEKSNIAYRAFRLRSPETIRRLTALTPATAVIFKPLCDAHLADRILEEHPRGRGIWMYRRWADVANSAVAKWGTHHKEVMDAIRSGALQELGWRGERLPQDLIDQVVAVTDQDSSAETGAALQWYLRNSFYFLLGLDKEPRVMLQAYEPLVEHPAEVFPALFDFIGVPFHAQYIEDVAPTSVGLRPAPSVDPRVARLCDALTERLDAAALTGRDGKGA
jgi:hypothetical protein